MFNKVLVCIIGAVMVVSSGCGMFKKSIKPPVVTPVVKVEEPKEVIKVEPKVIEPSALIYFKFDSSEVSLDEKSVELYVTTFKDKKISLIGNCCVIGSEDYNMKLGIRRAEAVRKKFMDIGLWVVKVGSNGELKAKNSKDKSKYYLDRFVEVTVE